MKTEKSGQPPMRKSYAAVSSVTLPKYQKPTQRSRRYKEQRSAFRKEEQEKERQLRKEKYAKIEKVRFLQEQLLEIRRSMVLERIEIINSEHFEGLQRTEPLRSILEEPFDSKKHTSEWYEMLKKDRLEKAKRFQERAPRKQGNVWRSPAWNHERAPSEQPEVLDLAKLSEMTASMTKEETKTFELSDLSKRTQQFEEENRQKKEKEMPSFFQNESVPQKDGLDEILNSALEDVTRPPPEEVVPEVSLPLEQPQVKVNVDHERLQREEQERMWRQQEYYRREEAYRLRMQQQRHRHAEWFYRDPQGNIQGPYDSQTMRNWFERKFFKDDLPIARNTPRNGFATIRQLFPDPRTAFLDFPPPPPPPQIQPTSNFFNQPQSQEQPLERLSAFDLERLNKQQQKLEESFNDFLDLDQTQESPSSPPQAPVVVKEKKKPKKKKKKEPQTQKLEGLSDNLKKMLGVKKQQEEAKDAKMANAKMVNPWKKTEQIKTETSLRKIQEEEQQKLKQDILNGTHQPSQSKVWANLVAKNALPQPQKFHSMSTKGKVKLPTEKYKKFLMWYKTHCIAQKLGFDERLFSAALAMEKPNDVRQLFKKHFGSSQNILKFATEFLNMKDKLTNSS